MPDSNLIKLPRAKTPEEVGVSSEAVLAMINDINASQAEEHGFMIIRHGKVAAESFKKPYSADMPHIMYSASKPVTSTAIGFAVNEGLITTETKVIDIFPEFRTKKNDEKLDKVTVKHLLTMSAGKMPNLLANKTKDKWLNHFFDAKWIFDPGNGWEYINENIFLLCAIIVRVTGKSVTEYLKPRLWDPLGIDSYFWETDPKGVESGGWGLFLSAESLGKFALCYLQGGIFDNKQVIPAEWAKIAVLNHKNLNEDESPNEDGGYGYCFWREKGDRKSYRAEGMFSEIGIVFEDHDAIIVSLGGEMDSGKAHKFIFNNFPKGFIDSTSGTKTNAELEKAILNRENKALPAEKHSKFENIINGKRIKFKYNMLLNIIGFPMSVLPLASTYMTKDRAGNINNVTFKFNGNECKLTWSEGDETNTVICGMDGEYRKSSIKLASTKYTAFSCAAWSGENKLTVWIIPVECIGKRILEFEFNGKNVNMTPSTIPDLSVMVNSISGGVTQYVKNKLLIKSARKGLAIIEKILEPVHNGIIKK